MEMMEKGKKRVVLRYPSGVSLIAAASRWHIKSLPAFSMFDSPVCAAETLNRTKNGHVEIVAKASIIEENFPPEEIKRLQEEGIMVTIDRI